MRRARLHRWTLWLLPLLLLRAALPAGVMLSTSEGRLLLELCSGFSIPAPQQHASQHDHAEHAGGSHHSAAVDHAAEAASQQHGSHEPGAADPAPCPYALVASACLAQAVHISVAHERTAPATPDFDSTPSRPPYFDPGRIRGPPSSLSS
ncbi:MAG TPA: hypothetical protein VK025_15780 [Steroidobacter sp.]|jgi:hypothetical protein|nr:hypothetical protein [Steroidobacteraceae bacterium]HLS82860.1 hypothetical protein [Steroidobacter sp.]